MSETACPQCGSPVREPGLAPLYQELRRIREIAESREADRVAELTREVAELRATVARLRGSALPVTGRTPARPWSGRTP